MPPLVALFFFSAAFPVSTHQMGISLHKFRSVFSGAPCSSITIINKATEPSCLHAHYPREHAQISSGPGNMLIFPAPAQGGVWCSSIRLDRCMQGEPAGFNSAKGITVPDQAFMSCTLSLSPFSQSHAIPLALLPLSHAVQSSAHYPLSSTPDCWSHSHHHNANGAQTFLSITLLVLWNHSRKLLCFADISWMITN